MPSIVQPVMSILGVAAGHPLSSVVIAAAALMLLARPGKSSYRV